MYGQRRPRPIRMRFSLRIVCVCVCAFFRLTFNWGYKLIAAGVVYVWPTPHPNDAWSHVNKIIATRRAEKIAISDDCRGASRWHGATVSAVSQRKASKTKGNYDGGGSGSIVTLYSISSDRLFSIWLADGDFIPIVSLGVWFFCRCPDRSGSLMQLRAIC